MKIVQQDLISLIKELVETNYQGWFSVLYEKKDGTVEWINCRLGVHKWEKGVGLGYSLEKAGCFSVFKRNADDPTRPYRSLKFDKVYEIKVEHKHLVLKESEYV